MQQLCKSVCSVRRAKIFFSGGSQFPVAKISHTEEILRKF